MSDLHRNYIAGEWVAGRRHREQHQSVRLERRHRRLCARRPGPGRRGDRRRARGVSCVGRVVGAGSRQLARHDRQRDPRAQGRARAPAVARGRQDAARGHRRSGARRPDLQVLRRRSAAPGRRKDSFGASRHRRRGHARADRRRRHHHAVEFSDRDSRLEDRAGAGLRQLRRVQAGGPRARIGVGARRNHRQRRRAQGRVQPGHGARQRRRRGDDQRQARRRHQLHRLGRDRPRDRRESDRSAWPSSSSKWAARIRWSSWTMPTWPWRSIARSTARSSRPASAAPRRRG